MEEQKGPQTGGYKKVTWPPASENLKMDANIKKDFFNVKENEIPQPNQKSQDFTGIKSISEPFQSFITLKPDLLISQKSTPIYQGQPAAINPTSGSMRGDLKWPPASIKEQMEAENRANIELAKGPLYRPLRVNKDYSHFFTQYTPTNNYPGYRAPPGTQYFASTSQY